MTNANFYRSTDWSTVKQKRIRIIPRLDIKGQNLIKGVQLEGLRVVGDPEEFAQKYYEDGADELIYSDVVASLYGRNSLLEMVAKTAKQVFIPLTVGGGIRSVNDVEALLKCGADKISVNSAAIKRPALISEISSRFGAQCCVVEIQAKVFGTGQWMALYDNGRENSERDAIDWAGEAMERGAGELLITSIDRDGSRKGMDLDLISKISSIAHVPIIACGGVGSPSDVCDAVDRAVVDAVAIGDLLHFGRASIREVKEYVTNNGIDVRI